MKWPSFHTFAITSLQHLPPASATVPVSSSSPSASASITWLAHPLVLYEHITSKMTPNQ